MPAERGPSGTGHDTAPAPEAAVYESATVLLLALKPWDAHGANVKAACTRLALALALAAVPVRAAGEGDTRP